jgi:hypothetical protein
MAHEQLLRGPGASGGTVRIGGTVRRTNDRAPPAMRLVLDHLRSVGFDAAPRILGKDEQDRWILSFIPGEVALPPYPRWAASDELLLSVARLLRRYHATVAGMPVPPGLEWPTVPPPPFRGRLACHMDVSMANVVCRDGAAIALIDFELLGLAAPAPVAA